MRFDRIFLCFFALFLIFPACTAATASAAKEADAATTPDDGDFLASLTFLGDSTTAHMANRAPIRDKSQVWMTKSRYLNLDSRITYAKIISPKSGKEEKIANVAAEIAPARLVVTLGIDYGVYYYRDKPDTFVFYYEKLLDEIAKASPSTNIILQSVFPVGKNSLAITNEMVKKANACIKEIAARRGLVYIDAFSHLVDEGGALAPQYCSSEDGIHLTEAAYRVVFDCLLAARGEIEGRDKK